MHSSFSFVENTQCDLFYSLSQKGIFMLQKSTSAAFEECTFKLQVNSH